MGMKTPLIILGAILAFKLLVKQAWGQEVRAVVDVVKANNAEFDYIPDGLILAIAKVESNLNPKATGAAGEYGLMQILPSTWNWIFQRSGIVPPQNPYDTYYNILGAMMLLDVHYRNLGSWFDVIHAYNVGSGAFANGIRNWSYFQSVLKYWFIV